MPYTASADAGSPTTTPPACSCTDVVVRWVLRKSTQMCPRYGPAAACIPGRRHRTKSNRYLQTGPTPPLAIRGPFPLAASHLLCCCGWLRDALLLNLNTIDNGCRVGSQAPTWPRDLPRGTNHDLAGQTPSSHFFFSISLFHFFLRHIRLEPYQPIREQELAIQLFPAIHRSVAQFFRARLCCLFPHNPGSSGALYTTADDEASHRLSDWLLICPHVKIHSSQTSKMGAGRKFFA
ncbi:uncharacterized protein J3D65DRAFT_232084 [Phyllosticta citribraziliensis]|uniref:Uncharacterized protein n=1 Tax=Phyllosticta citribraziliensis TaxID=989973 RepID=A0ABR1M991_9PEZI